MLEDFAALRAAGRERAADDRPVDAHAPRARGRGHARRARRGCAPACSTMTGSSRPRRVRSWSPASDRGRVARSAELAAARHRRARLWLGEDRRLDPEPPSDRDAGDRYRYDPADPTPSLGGPVLLAREPVVDNRPLEARPDVLTYTTPALPIGDRGDRTGARRAVACAPARRISTCSRGCATSIRRAPRGTCATRSRASRPERFERRPDGTLARRLRPVADRPPVRRRPPDPPSGLLGRAPAVRPQPRHGRGPAHRDRRCRPSTSSYCTAGPAVGADPAAQSVSAVTCAAAGTRRRCGGSP